MGSPLTIGEDCTIGHNAILHGCTIGDGSLIGMGAIVLNGARIGRGCLVGAGALVTEGKELPDHSLIVGSPAKAIRTLDAEAVAALRHAAAHYVENWRRFAAGLKRIDGGAERSASRPASGEKRDARPTLSGCRACARNGRRPKGRGRAPLVGGVGLDLAPSGQRRRAGADQAEPVGADARRERAEHAGVGRALMAQRQQGDLDLDRLEASRPRLPDAGGTGLPRRRRPAGST